MACRELACAELSSADRNSGSVRNSAVRRKSHFDWIAWCHVEPVKPSRRPTGENRDVRKTRVGRDEHHHWAVGDLMPGIQTGPNASPTRADELVLGQAITLG